MSLSRLAGASFPEKVAFGLDLKEVRAGAVRYLGKECSKLRE